MSPAPQHHTTDVNNNRISLRPLEPVDASLYRKIYCDPETMRYVGKPLSTDDATRSFQVALRQQKKSSAGTLTFVAIDTVTDVKLGICGARLGLPRLESAEVGIMLVGAVRGQGFSHHVLGNFIHKVFDLFGIQQVWVRYAIEQTAVVRLNRGLGFTVSDENLSNDCSHQRASIQKENWRGVGYSVDRGK